MLETPPYKLITAEDLFSVITKNPSLYHLDLMRQAYDFASRAHKGQKRKTGEDYIHHPLAVSYRLASMHFDEATVIAGLLHDVPEDTNISLNDIQRNFGLEVANLVDGVTKLGKLRYQGVDRYAENLRKMFISMAEDVRVLFIKFIDRIHNLTTLSILPPDKQKRIASESLQIYAQIAHRLGIREIRTEMEDLAFSYLLPTEYVETKKLFEERMPLANKNVSEAAEQLQEHLKKEKVPFISIQSRVKHLFALYQKLQRREIDRIYDIVALRVITKTEGDCYRTLGSIHGLWRPFPDRLKDFIAIPKPNGYQSIHTTVFMPNGSPLECQIRTEEMHENAEFGIAAHFIYKHKGGESTKHLEWLKRLQEWQKEVGDNDKFLEAIKMDFFEERIFVFTPRGDAIDLPLGATPLDFAYHIHSEVGNGCVGSYINQVLKPLQTPLKNGDVVEIVVDKNRKHPSEEWLKFTKTHQAQDHIKTALNKEKRSLIERLFSTKK